MNVLKYDIQIKIQTDTQSSIVIPLFEYSIYYTTSSFASYKLKKYTKPPSRK